MDTVILHTARSERRAGRLADSLTERATVLVSVAVGQPKPIFGAQMLVVGVVAGQVAPNSDEAWLIELVRQSPGRKLLVIPPAQAPADFDPGVLIEPKPEIEALAQAIRDAIALGAAPVSKKQMKRDREKGAAPPAMRAPPTPPREKVVAVGGGSAAAAAVAMPAPAPAPVAPAAPAPRQEAEIVALDSRRRDRAAPNPAPAPEVHAFDPSKAQRARKFGFVFGVGIGVIVALGVLFFYLQVRRPAAPVAPPVEAPVTTQAPAVAAPPEAIIEAPAAVEPEAPVLRGRTDAEEPPAVAPAPVTPPPATQAPAAQPPVAQAPAPAETTPAPTLEPVPTE